VGKIQIQHWQQLHFRLLLIQCKSSGLPFLASELPVPQTYVVGLAKRKCLFRADSDATCEGLPLTIGTDSPAAVTLDTSHFGTTELAERCDLMPLLSWQLWLAREIVKDNPLPWQKQQTDLTPGRVSQGFPALLAAIGTPAVDPKPRGKSPGWPQSRPKRTRYPVVKKTTPKPFSETAESKICLKPEIIKHVLRSQHVQAAESICHVHYLYFLSQLVKLQYKSNIDTL